jgi:hypothetical protein
MNNELAELQTENCKLKTKGGPQPSGRPLYL